MASIEEEIQQSSFKSPYIKLAVNLLFTTSWFNKIQNDYLKNYNLTYQQFNVMRILKGQKGSPASIKLITERMLDKQSNASRLVDKLIQKGLVEKNINEKDRRQTDIFLTLPGLKLVDQLIDEIQVLVDERFSSLSEADAEKCNDLLDELRSD